MQNSSGYKEKKTTGRKMWLVFFPRDLLKLKEVENWSPIPTYFLVSVVILSHGLCINRAVIELGSNFELFFYNVRKLN